MMENDLVDKLAELEYDQGENGLWESACREVKAIYWQHVTKDFLPIIRSYANGLVAAAVEACAQHQAGDYNGGEYDWGCVCGARGHSGCDGELDTWSNHIRSAVTPEFAAKELERIKNEARQEEHALDCLFCRCCDGCRKLCQRRSALEAAKEK